MVALEELVIIVFISTVGCTDFNEDKWSLFDSAMMQEWNITSYTYCLQMDKYPHNRLPLYKIQQEMNIPSQIVFITPYDEDIFRSTITRGTASVEKNVAFIQKNLSEDRITKTTSHEILHLWLEETGESERCYSNFVHVHRKHFTEYYDDYWFNRLSIMSKFDCPAQ